MKKAPFSSHLMKLFRALLLSSSPSPCGLALAPASLGDDAQEKAASVGREEAFFSSPGEVGQPADCDPGQLVLDCAFSVEIRVSSCRRASTAVSEHPAEERAQGSGVETSDRLSWAANSAEATKARQNAEENEKVKKSLPAMGLQPWPAVGRDGVVCAEVNGSEIGGRTGRTVKGR
ncbi:hypothetical protein TGDOM2_365160 [Toxoplasma gondii GAB2-2007-GAL-DOM2]|uniref:Uncharacterized protein n=1 Tax=Toxoplasma gondii GAB2-2007-GAL-DOM2 TaxID=1130820 RepID=A0A086JW41_TOXGO|nr:hypothetical protein TGDOM2_365160 [Toxoplasma gondii GAB2-2007-GAL-DOM2]